MPDYPSLSDLESATPAPDPTPPPAPAPSSPARPVLEWLEGEGFRARVDDDGDIHLRHEGRDVFIVFDTADPAYLRVIVPDVWRCDDSAEERSVALGVANRLNAALKVAKVCLRTDGAVHASVEVFENNPSAFCMVLPRHLGVLGTAAWEFRERMKEELRNRGSEEAEDSAEAEESGNPELLGPSGPSGEA
jgi:hypothetical protein